MLTDARITQLVVELLRDPRHADVRLRQESAIAFGRLVEAEVREECAWPIDLVMDRAIEALEKKRTAASTADAIRSKEPT